MTKNKTSKSFLSFSFAPGFTSPNIPIVTFNQGDKELNFIIDTGSDDNVVNRNTLKDITHEMIEYEGTLSGVGGTFSIEACNIPFQYGDEKFTAKFIISDHLQQAFDEIRKAHAIPLHGMLGSKFIKNNNLVLDFNNMVAYNQDK